MTKYGLHGMFKAKEGKRDELATILMDASKIVANIKGCLLYIISKDPQNSDTIWITEIWETKGDHDNSLNDPDVRAIISRAIPLLGDTPGKGQELDTLGGFGL